MVEVWFNVLGSSKEMSVADENAETDKWQEAKG